MKNIYITILLGIFILLFISPVFGSEKKECKNVLENCIVRPWSVK